MRSILVGIGLLVTVIAGLASAGSAEGPLAAERPAPGPGPSGSVQYFEEILGAVGRLLDESILDNWENVEDFIDGLQLT